MEFVLIASAHFLALLSPGPDFFLILQTTLRLSLRYAIAVCAGIATANALYLVLAVLGLEMVRHWTPAIMILRSLGAAYLVYIGIALLRAPMRPVNGETATTFLHLPRLSRQYTLGLMSALLNPKNAIFYLSLFTAMVSPQTSLGMRSLYGLWMATLVLLWDIGIAMLIGNDRVKPALGCWIYRIEKGAGAILTIFGLLLAYDYT